LEPKQATRGNSFTIEFDEPKSPQNVEYSRRYGCGTVNNSEVEIKPHLYELSLGSDGRFIITAYFQYQREGSSDGGQPKKLFYYYERIFGDSGSSNNSDLQIQISFSEIK
jgi:hypothetical protein